MEYFLFGQVNIDFRSSILAKKEREIWVRLMFGLKRNIFRSLGSSQPDE